MASAPAAGLALWPLPLPALVGLLGGLALTGAGSAWLLRSLAAGPGRAPAPAAPPPGLAVAPGALPSPTARPTELADLVRRLEVLEARQAWLDAGMDELEAYAQALAVEPTGDDDRSP